MNGGNGTSRALSFIDRFEKMRHMNRPDSCMPPMVVGTIHSAGALKCALKLKPNQIDLLELRVDAFANDPEVLLRAIPKLPAPLLVTVRHPPRGGWRHTRPGGGGS